MSNKKKESCYFFISTLSKYIGLEEAYIYLKLAKNLKLDIVINIFNNFKNEKDIIEIILYGTQESVDKFNHLWNKLEVNKEIKMELDRFFSIYAKELEKINIKKA